MKKLRIFNSGGWPGEVHRCMVWFVKSNQHGNRGPGYAEASMAYGESPERATLTEAMNDLVVLKMGMMKNDRPDGVFFANVMTYPAGHPPKRMTRELFLEMGGDE